MNEFRGAEHSDEAMLMLDLSDEALENAAGSVWEKAGSDDARFLLRASIAAQVVSGVEGQVNRFRPPVFQPSCRTVLRRLTRRQPPGASSHIVTVGILRTATTARHCKSCPAGALHAEIRHLHLLVVCKLRARALDDHFPTFQHIGALHHAQSPADVLFDKQNRRAHRVYF